MDLLEKIKQPLSNELAEYENFVRETLQSGDRYIGSIIDYIISGRGKRIRPLLTLLFAAVQNGNPGKRTFLSALLVEMIHTASLTHDDVVDDASVRHGRPSVNSQWDSHTAVLIGDYILARAFTIGMKSGQYDVVSYITSSIDDLCEGELIQSYHNQRFDTTREVYLDIIFKKTATLIGTSCGVGALSAGATADQTEIARRTGVDLGMAFQIKDDMLDYAPSARTGKAPYADLKERKITLPLLTVLEKCSERSRAEIIETFRAIDRHPENIVRISSIVTDGGGIEAAAEVMDDYLSRARLLINRYEPSAYRDSLLQLCTYIGSRDK